MALQQAATRKIKNFSKRHCHEIRKKNTDKK